MDYVTKNSRFTRSLVITLVAEHAEYFMKHSSRLRYSPWAEDIANQLARTADITHVLSDRYLCSLMSVEGTVDLVRRAAQLETINLTHSYRVSDVRYEDFIKAFDSPDLTTPEMVTWLILSGDDDLTFKFLTGSLTRKPRDEDLDAIVSRQDEVFARGTLRSLLSNIDGWRRALGDRHFDALVDAAGREFAVYGLRQNSAAVGAYLADRLRRETDTIDQWRMALDLLTRSTMSVGATISAARRLSNAQRSVS